MLYSCSTRQIILTKKFNWISASAGTGKTTYIINAINELLNEGIKAESILCISFTNAALDEMRTKIHHLCKPMMSTIHSLGKDLLEIDKDIGDITLLRSLVTQAINTVLCDSYWFNFIQSMYSNQNSIFSEIESIVFSENINSIKNALSKFTASKKSNPSTKIDISKNTLDELMKIGLTKFVDYLLSNDIHVYRAQLLTKELKIKQYYMHKKVHDKLSVQASAELASIVKKIEDTVITSINEEHIKKSIIFNEFILRIYDEYSILKKAYKVLDFNDLIIGNITVDGQLMCIKHIFLDEAQDTSPKQQEFFMQVVNTVIRHHTFTITVVGDVKQSIYSSTSTHLNYAKFKNDLKKIADSIRVPLHEHSLSHSRRVPDRIVQFIKNIVFTNKNILTNDRGNANDGYIKIWKQKCANVEPPTWGSWARYETPKWIKIFIDECKNIITKGYKYSQICLLFQQRSDWIYQLIHELEVNNIPVSEYPLPLHTNTVIYELMMLIEFIVDNSHDAALAVVIKGPYFKCNDKDLLSICANRKGSLLDALSKSRLDCMKKIYEEIINIALFEAETLYFFSNVLFKTKYGQFLCKFYPHEIDLFWNQVVNFSLCNASLTKFLSYLYNMPNSYTLNIDGIRISTIHGFKGKEGQHVFIAASHIAPVYNTLLPIMWNGIMLCRGVYPLYTDTRSQYISQKNMESDNLLYVALTRTKNSIYILPPPENSKIHQDSFYSRIMDSIKVDDNHQDFHEIY